MQYEWAQPGRLVVCVDGSLRTGWLAANWPEIVWTTRVEVVRGTVYTVRSTAVHPVTREVCIKLEEIPDRPCKDSGYAVSRFRPVNTQIIDALLKVEENA